MNHVENWIWLPKDKYENEQKTVISGFEKEKANNYTVAEFEKKYSFEKTVSCVELRFCGDALFQLFLNDNIVATGPVCVGGDFIGNERIRENFYAFEHTLYPNSKELNFFARVQMLPVHLCEFSSGHGGFMLSAIITFEDKTQTEIHTDQDWLVRKNGAYTYYNSFDGRIAADEFVFAENIKNIWNTTTAPIPVREENIILCENSTINLLPFEEKEVYLEFDKIWAGFILVNSKSTGEVFVDLQCRELKENPRKESLIFIGEQEYRGFYLHSVGNIVAKVKNSTDKNVNITISYASTHYPIYEEAQTLTSDNDLNQVLETCKHTLKICRQTHHLDSPLHCEPLACTGDYYIETLMTPFSFGDLRLAEFDLIRTAYMLERENGRLFHTTYSLIWVKMLYDVYMITGNVSLLKDCKKALDLLLACFETYIGENGLIETPPDYMFIDWIYIDEISMHHPPKALGQTCLNMFYFGALDCAQKIYRVLKREDFAEACVMKREAIRTAVNSLLFDSEKVCYFEGLNTLTNTELLGEWMPQNVSKRYYLKHSNVLAAYFGICDDNTARTLVHKIMADEIDNDCQPYFLHYLLEAVYRLGLREEYTLKIINRWKKPVLECTKGLVEGFIAPEPTYSFDHSHAWGGTPLYSLPKALMGLNILSAGMKEIELSPSLLGLKYAKTELLTPHGKIICQTKEGEKPCIQCPDNIKVII